MSRVIPPRAGHVEIMPSFTQGFLLSCSCLGDALDARPSASSAHLSGAVKVTASYIASCCRVHRLGFLQPEPTTERHVAAILVHLGDRRSDLSCVKVNMRSFVLMEGNVARRAAATCLLVAHSEGRLPDARRKGLDARGVRYLFFFYE